MTASQTCVLYAILFACCFVLPVEAFECSGSAAFNINSEIHADGSVTLKLDLSRHVQGLRRVNLEEELAGVTYEESDGTHRTRLTLSFDDVDSMSKVPAIESFELRAPELWQSGDLRLLRFDSRRIKMQAAHMRLRGVADDASALCWQIHLPGNVLESNASKVEGQTATWTLTVGDFWNLKDPILEVIFEKSSNEAALTPD